MKTIFRILPFLVLSLSLQVMAKDLNRLPLTELFEDELFSIEMKGIDTLGGLNGTLVNGKVVTSTLLSDKDNKSPRCLIQVLGNRDDFPHKTSDGKEVYHIEPKGMYGVSNVHSSPNGILSFDLKNGGAKPSDIGFFCSSPNRAHRLTYKDLSQILGKLGKINTSYGTPANVRREDPTGDGAH